MEKNLSSLFVGVILSIVLGITSAYAKQSVEKDVEVRIYEVWGMDCPGCHGGVEKLVEKIAGVHSAKANWKLQHVVVKADKNLLNKAVFEAIENANFTPSKIVKTEAKNQ